MATNRCPDRELLLSLALGDPDIPELEMHVKDCAACQTEVDRLRGEVASLRKSLSQDQTNTPRPSTWSLKPDSDTRKDAQPNSRTVSLSAGLELVPGYRLMRPLGKGAFAEVWEATGPGGMRLALKVLPLHGAAPSMELRALELMKDVRHPHLLTLSAYWQIDSLLVIAMELAEGTLWHRFQECRQRGLRGIPAEELRGHIQDAADAIDYLNGARARPDGNTRPAIQHRDIKPANLLLVGGRVKAGDFGLAKLLIQDVATHTAAMTIPYAAPECFDNRTTPFSDQYSLAVTYCQLLSGRLPFDGPAAAVMAGHLHGAPDLSMLPLAEHDIVARALAKKPENRWPSCMAFVKALHEATSKTPAPANATPTSFFVEPTQLELPAPAPAAPPSPSTAAVKNVRPEVVFSLNLVLGVFAIVASMVLDSQFTYDLRRQHEIARHGILLGICYLVLALMGLRTGWKRTAYYYGGLLCALTLFPWAPAALLQGEIHQKALYVIFTVLTFLCVAKLYYLSSRTVTEASGPRGPSLWPLRALLLGVLLLPIFAAGLLQYLGGPPYLVVPSICSIVVNGLYLILPEARRNRTLWLPVSFAVVPFLIAVTYIVGTAVHGVPVQIF